MGLGNYVSDFEAMDLITPNRLRLGRNNERSPVGHLSIPSSFDKTLKANVKIFNSWFENWLVVHVPKLMHHPKWFKSDFHIKVGDIVLFLKHESSLSNVYQYGMVIDTEQSRDGLIRKVKLKYKNHNEDVTRETFRSVRNLVMIHQIEELNVMEELYEMARYVDQKFQKQ